MAKKCNDGIVLVVIAKRKNADAMFLNHSTYYFCLILSLLVSVMGKAQLGGLGGPLLNIDFGQAAGDRITEAGLPLSTGRTEFIFSTDICPPQGMYTVINGAPQACDDSSLITLFADNTPLPDNNGNMMVLHDVAHSSQKILFEHTVSPCINVDYRFSAALINLDKPNSGGCTRFSSFTLEVRDGAGVLLGSTTTGDMQFAVNNFGYSFNKPFVPFRLSSNNLLPVTVRIIDEPKAISACHNFVGIDDIKVSVTGIEADVQFDDTPPGYGWWVKSSCFQDNKSFTMEATIETSLINPAIQWEQSTDEGFTWIDIPGATNSILTQSFPVADTFLFRLRVARQELISTAGCGISTQLLKVQVDGLPPVHKSTNNSPVCAGNQIKFDAEGGTTYEWHGPNGFYDNIKFPGIFRSKLKDSGWYYTDIITAGGCRVKDSTYVKIIGTDVNAGSDTSICISTSAMLNASEGATWQWTPTIRLSTATVKNPSASPIETTLYSVFVTDKYGCSGKDEVKVVVKNKQKVSAGIYSSKYICRLSDSILFANRSTGIIDTWQWSFGDGRTSSAQNPPIQYYNNVSANIISYTVSLVIIDTAGCSDTTFQTLKLEDMCNMAVPSAFTPNGDGLNDYFRPLNAFKANNTTFTVFNRKGIKVFETKQWPGKWDGTYKGEPQDAGTYVWMFQYTDIIGKKQLLKGTVALLR